MTDSSDDAAAAVPPPSEAADVAKDAAPAAPAASAESEGAAESAAAPAAAAPAAASISLRPGGDVGGISLRPGGGLGGFLRPGGAGGFSMRPAGPSFTSPDGSAKKPAQIKASPNRKVPERTRVTKRDRKTYSRELILSLKGKYTAVPAQGAMDRIPGVFCVGESGRDTSSGSGKAELRNQAKDKWVPPSMRSGMNFTIDQDEIRKERFIEQVRYVQGLLNKVTPENFSTISKKLVESYEESEGHEVLLKEHCLLVFEKALSEPNYASMWGDLCTYLSGDQSSKGSDPRESIHALFRSEVLNMCQREFERMKQEFKKPEESFDEELHIKKRAGTLTEDEANELEERRIKRKSRRLGTIKFIGELFKKNLLTKKIMHYCLQQLFSDDLQEAPMHERLNNLEAFCKLMKTVGESLDRTPRDMDHMNVAYFAKLKALAADENYPYRLRFMVEDIVELRAENWRDKRGHGVNPTTISQVHANAAKKARGEEVTAAPSLAAPAAASPKKAEPKLTTEQLTNKSNLLLKEYLMSRDNVEAVECVKELSSPSYNSKIVENGLNIVLESTEYKQDLPAMCKLFAVLKAECGFSSKDFNDGVVPFLENLSDIALDVPSAPEVVKGAVEALMRSGCLPPSFMLDRFQLLTDSKHQQLFYPLLS